MSSLKQQRQLFGERLRELRKLNHLTQAEFAARINVSQVAVGRYEAGSRIPDLFVTMNIIDQFDCSLEWLALGRGEGLGGKKI